MLDCSRATDAGGLTQYRPLGVSTRSRYTSRMGKRLSKIYTRTGDDGTTGIGDGSRVPKTDARVEAMGAVDELNSAQGLLIAALTRDDNRFGEVLSFLSWLQHRTFDLGGELSIPNFVLITDEHVTRVEAELDRLNNELAPLENFILPAGSGSIAKAHMARSICRRAERRLVALASEAPVNEPGRQLLNRLSDYFFVLARHIARIDGVPEVLWQKDV